jgi:signal transduction histidine kinase
MDSVHPEDRERIRQAAHTKQITGQYDEQYRIVCPDGSLRWIHDRAFPIRDDNGEVCRIAGIAEDITERRRMERQILEISEQERARIGHEIHDGLCQQLVGIMFMTRFLRDQLLAHHPAESDEAMEIGRLLQESINQARSISYNLYPAHLVDSGLCGALQQLAEQTSAQVKVSCHLECAKPVKIGNTAVLLNLYRIAQEAVANVLKHASPRHIKIRLTGDNGVVELVIEDDGIGIPDGERRANGLGLQIMQYRANVIGGTVEIKRRSEGGTIVTCRCSSAG